MSTGIIAIPELSPDELIFLADNPAYKIFLQIWVVMFNHAEKDPDFERPLRYAVDPDVKDAHRIAVFTRSHLNKLGWNVELEEKTTTLIISRYPPAKEQPPD